MVSLKQYVCPNEHRKLSELHANVPEDIHTSLLEPLRTAQTEHMVTLYH